MKENLKNYLENIKSPNRTTASIMDENTFFDCVNTLYGTQIYSKEDLKDAGLFHIFYYSIADDKKQFDIATVRQATIDITIQPASGKNFLVFEDFDTAGVPAQNAALKLIEDCPDYAVIFLIVKNPKKLLGTIESRTMNFFEMQKNNFLSDEIKEKLEKFLSGNVADWLGYMYENDFSKDEVFSILTMVFSRVDSQIQKEIKNIFIALETVNEKPKNLLEKIFLCEKFYN